jgi:hydroxyethylthiazole kinase-like uncharacterized protein yjeF
MKILTAKQIRKIDAETISREGISSLELMKRAATAFYRWFIARYDRKETSVLIFAGVGNNGGDALVVARLLQKAGFPVNVFVVEYSRAYSEDCMHNIRRAKAENIPCTTIASENDFPSMEEYDVLIDGIFGTGLNRDVNGWARDVITRINESGKRVISIDVPSGLFLDRETPFAIKASETVTFQIPKLALYLPGNRYFCGDVWNVDIGLSEGAIAETETDTFFTRKEEATALLKPLSRFTHKGMLGHALLIGGSFGMAGSVCLASKAALKTGCGLVTAYLPKCGVSVIQSYFPEAMALADRQENHLAAIDYTLKPDAIGIGVGMGQHGDTHHALHEFLKQNRAPLVVDADALNILAQHTDWFSLLPRGTILTPHPKELSRLVGEWNDDFEKIRKARKFAKQHEVIVVIKGAFSLVIDHETTHVNSSGTPALATAGSGDVLTGMITSLRAQGYSSLDAARLGVYLHGLTADLSRERVHARAFVASDIIDGIGNAYKHLEGDA